jgi:hypothetical protein
MRKFILRIIENWIREFESARLMKHHYEKYRDDK